MCVACPARVVSVGTASAASRRGRVVAGGVERDVDLVMVPEAGPGDHVIIHSGYAIRVVDADAAAEAIGLLEDGHV